MGDDSRLSWWTQCDHKDLYKRERRMSEAEKEINDGSRALL